MEIKALRFKLSQEAEKSKEEPEKTPKFDSGLPTGGGTGWRELPPDEKLRFGLTKRK